MNSMPQWDFVERAFHGIFERRYFANNGPLVQEFDRRFAEAHGVAYAAAVTNRTVALALAAKAVAPDGGEVIVPAYVSPSAIAAFAWAGLTPRRVDVQPNEIVLSAEAAAMGLTPRTKAIFAVQMFGFPIDQKLAAFAGERGLALFSDATDAVGMREREPGCIARVYALDETSACNAADSACITTNDEQLSKVLRTMRNFHAGETFAPVPLRMNGKMSEAQAALSLCSMDALDETIARNRERFALYRDALLAGGLGLAAPSDPFASNCARIVIRTESRRAADIREALGLARIPEEAAYPGVQTLRASLVELPNNHGMTSHDIAAVCAKVLAA